MKPKKHHPERRQQSLCRQIVKLRYYQLDIADVTLLQQFIRSEWPEIPDEYKPSLLAIYDDLDHPKNPKNIRFQ